MKFFKKTLATMLALAMLSSATVFPVYAVEGEDPVDIPGVEEQVGEPTTPEIPDVPAEIDMTQFEAQFGALDELAAFAQEIIDAYEIDELTQTTLTEKLEAKGYESLDALSDEIETAVEALVIGLTEAGMAEEAAAEKVAGYSAASEKLLAVEVEAPEVPEIPEIPEEVPAEIDMTQFEDQFNALDELIAFAEEIIDAYENSELTQMILDEMLEWMGYESMDDLIGEIEDAIDALVGDMTDAGMTEEAATEEVAVYAAAPMMLMSVEDELMTTAVDPTGTKLENNSSVAYFYLWTGDEGSYSSENWTDGSWEAFGMGYLDFSVLGLTNDEAKDKYPALNMSWTDANPNNYVPVDSSQIANMVTSSGLTDFPEIVPQYAYDKGTFTNGYNQNTKIELNADGGYFPVIDGYYYEGDPAKPADADTYTVEWRDIVAEFSSDCNGHEYQSGSFIGFPIYSTAKWADGAKPGNWHVNGVVKFNDKVYSTFYVEQLDAGGTYKSVQQNVMNENQKYSDIVQPTDYVPGTTTTSYGGMDYVFDGWYTGTVDETSGEVTLGSKVTFGSAKITESVNFYGCWIPTTPTYTVTYVYKNSDGEDVKKEYGCKGPGYAVPLPYGPDGGTDSDYFAGWTYYNANGDLVTSYGHYNSGSGESGIAWVADAKNTKKMTITASYYTDHTNTTEDYISADLNGCECNEPVETDMDAAKIYTPLFGDVKLVTDGTNKYLIAKINLGFSDFDGGKDTGNGDNDKGMIVAKNNAYKSVGFVVAADGTEVAQNPTVQGGYAYSKSGDVFTSLSVAGGVLNLDNAGGYYVVIKAVDNVKYATPYAILDEGNVYHYGQGVDVSELTVVNLPIQ